MVAEVIIQKEPKKVTKRYTLEEYFELEEKTPSKNEFVNGKIIPMAGGTIEHGEITGHIYALLLMLFFNSDELINVYSNDQKVYVEEYRRIAYTDTFVVVGETERHQGKNQTITNPTLIFEVASESTEKFDRTGKFRMYQSLPSFKEYVIVSQTMPIVEVYYKIEDNKWQITSYIGLDKIVKFDTLDVELKMSDIYKKITNLKNPQTYIEFPEED
ncbi:MAG: Uma2 family endonuclease [Saprospiraceae bacterium]